MRSNFLVDSIFCSEKYRLLYIHGSARICMCERETETETVTERERETETETETEREEGERA